MSVSRNPNPAAGRKLDLDDACPLARWWGYRSVSGVTAIGSNVAGILRPFIELPAPPEQLAGVIPSRSCDFGSDRTRLHRRCNNPFLLPWRRSTDVITSTAFRERPHRARTEWAIITLTQQAA
jgi:hypothetical protein